MDKLRNSDDDERRAKRARSRVRQDTHPCDLRAAGSCHGILEGLLLGQCAARGKASQTARNGGGTRGAGTNPRLLTIAGRTTTVSIVLSGALPCPKPFSNIFFTRADSLHVGQREVRSDDTSKGRQLSASEARVAGHHHHDGFESSAESYAEPPEILKEERQEVITDH